MARSPTLSPREGTKLAQLIGLLRRENGATLAELAAATGWLPHTTRWAVQVAGLIVCWPRLILKLHRADSRAG
jgi:hypothetical protein